MASELTEKEITQKLTSKIFQMCSTAQKTRRDNTIMQHRIQSFAANRTQQPVFPTTASPSPFPNYCEPPSEPSFYTTDYGLMGVTKQQFFKMIDAHVANTQQEPVHNNYPKQVKVQREVGFKPFLKEQKGERQVRRPENIYKEKPVLARRYIKTNRKLGEGAESIVYEGVDQQTGRKVAIKVLVSRYTDNEIRIMQGMGECENVLKMYDHWIEDGKMSIALELCDGNLEEMKKRASLKERYQYFKEILNGMKHLDRNGILHRDMKLYNILVKDNTIKLSDFGFAKYIGARLAVESRQCGTPATMAPEVLFAQRKGKVVYDRKSDIWPLGVILHELIYDCHPFNYEQDRIERGRRVSVKNPIPGIQKILNKILVWDTRSRINLSDLIKMFDTFLRLDDMTCDGEETLSQVETPIPHARINYDGGNRRRQEEKFRINQELIRRQNEQKYVYNKRRVIQEVPEGENERVGFDHVNQNRNRLKIGYNGGRTMTRSDQQQSTGQRVEHGNKDQVSIWGALGIWGFLCLAVYLWSMFPSP